MEIVLVLPILSLGGENIVFLISVGSGCYRFSVAVHLENSITMSLWLYIRSWAGHQQVCLVSTNAALVMVVVWT